MINSKRKRWSGTRGRASSSWRSHTTWRWRKPSPSSTSRGRASSSSAGSARRRSSTTRTARARTSSRPAGGTGRARSPTTSAAPPPAAASVSAAWPTRAWTSPWPVTATPTTTSGERTLATSPTRMTSLSSSLSLETLVCSSVGPVDVLHVVFTLLRSKLKLFT